jgi:hypothetical protein
MSYELTDRMLMDGIDDLTAAEFWVLLLLGHFTNHKTGQCNPSQSTLAAKARISRRSTIDALNGLEAKGYIVRQKAYRKGGGKAPCNYIVNQGRLPICRSTNVRHTHIANETNVRHTHIECAPHAHCNARHVHINKEYMNKEYEQDKPPLPPKGGTVPKATKPKFDPKAMTVPDALNADAWHEWIEYRVDRKKPITQLSAKKQVAELAKYSHETQQQMVDTSIANGWQGLFPPKVNGNTMSAEAKAQRDNDLMVGARLLAEAAMRKRTPH